jgi:hypothetical protein
MDHMQPVLLRRYAGLPNTLSVWMGPPTIHPKCNNFVNNAKIMLHVA